MNIFIRWLMAAALVMLVSYIVPGIEVTNWWTALLVALVLGLLNAVIRPLIVILTLPVTIITLGLFMFVINASLLLLTSTIINGFDVNGFWTAMLGSIVLAVLGFLINPLTKK